MNRHRITGTIPAWYHHDRLGSTRVLTDNTGAVVGTFTYDPYGATTASTGSATTPIGYAGAYKDSESGFLYLINRYYNPTTAQFLTRDPLDTLTTSAYGYTGDNPLNATDPRGLMPCLPGGPCGSVHALSSYCPNGGDGGGSGAMAIAAIAPLAKFHDYLFKPGADHGKDAIFRSYGYGRADSQALSDEFASQAQAAYDSGDFVLGKATPYGQNITINITLKGQGAAAGRSTVIKTGWQIQDDGSLSLNTPFAGFVGPKPDLSGLPVSGETDAESAGSAQSWWEDLLQSLDDGGADG